MNNILDSQHKIENEERNHKTNTTDESTKRHDEKILQNFVQTSGHLRKRNMDYNTLPGLRFLKYVARDTRASSRRNRNKRRAWS